MQGMRRGLHLRAQENTFSVHGVRWEPDLRAQENAFSVQGVRRGRDLQAQGAALYLQGVLSCLDLQAQKAAFSVQGAPSARLFPLAPAVAVLFLLSSSNTPAINTKEEGKTKHNQYIQRGATAVEASPLPSPSDDTRLDRDGAPCLFAPSARLRMA